jgi:hypothetical protein
MISKLLIQGIATCMLVVSMAGCGGGGDGGGGTVPPPSNDVDLSTQERAALVAALQSLETSSIDSGQAQAARAARGAAMGIQGGTKMTGVTITGCGDLQE